MLEGEVDVHLTPDGPVIDHSIFLIVSRQPYDFYLSDLPAFCSNIEDFRGRWEVCSWLTGISTYICDHDRWRCSDGILGILAVVTIPEE